MSYGINIKEVYITGVTKHSVTSRKIDAENMLTYYKEKLIALAASQEYDKERFDSLADAAMFSVREIWDEIVEEAFLACILARAEENMEDVEDE